MRWRHEYDPDDMHMKHPEAIPEYLEVCGICGGNGAYRQTYTNGCGMGTSRFNGPCDYCQQTGLRYRGIDYWDRAGAAPMSVLAQIRETVRRMTEVA